MEGRFAGRPSAPRVQSHRPSEEGIGNEQDKMGPSRANRIARIAITAMTVVVAALAGAWAVTAVPRPTLAR